MRLPKIPIQKWFCLKLGWFCKYKTVKLCKKSGKIEGEHCRETEEKKLIKWIAPTEECSTCPPPEPYPVCRESDLHANPWCPDYRIVLFYEDEVPGFCDIHKPPPPPPSIPKIRDGMKREDCGFIVSPFFNPSMLIEKFEIGYMAGQWLRPSLKIQPIKIQAFEKIMLGEKDFFEKFTDKFAEENVGNTQRDFAWGVWDADTYDVVHFPHLKEDGKFILDEINQEWKDTLFKRIAYRAARRIVTQVDIYDNCQLHNYPNSHWGLHWLNPKNNWGWFGQETDPWGGTVYHWYEYDTPETNPNFWRHCKATGAYLTWITDWLVTVLIKEFGEYVIFGHNEILAGSVWHNSIVHPIYAKHGLTKDRLITSLDTGDWTEKFRDEKVLDKYSLSIHGIISEEAYNRARSTQWLEGENRWYQTIPNDIKVMLSGDGVVWRRNDPELRRLVAIVKRDKMLGLELNSGLWESPEWDWESARLMRDLFLE